MSLLPNLFIVGAAKSGTSALASILDAHPQVYFPPYKKEPRFFSDDELFGKGIAWFSKYYQGADHYLWRGDASPHYLHWSEKVAPRIRQALAGDRPKFLAILRDPTARAYSHYQHSISMGFDGMNFQDALANEDERMRSHSDELREKGLIRWGYFRGGCYASLLKPYFDLFPREDFLILLNEDLRDDFPATATRLISSLGLDPRFKLRLRFINEAGIPRSRKIQKWFYEDAPEKNMIRKIVPFSIRYRVRKFLLRLNRHQIKYEPMPKEIETMLRRKYLPEVQELEQMTKLSLRNWYPG